MKKTARKPSKVSLQPPKGWPSPKVIKEAEKKLKGQLSTKLLDPQAGPVERMKHELCEQFIRYHIAEKITQRELAKRLEITENRVSEILHYRNELFTIDRLIELLSRIKPDIKIKVA